MKRERQPMLSRESHVHQHGAQVTDENLIKQSIQAGVATRAALEGCVV